VARQKYESKRTKALEFAKHIPKPKVERVVENDGIGKNRSQAVVRSSRSAGQYSEMAGGLYMDSDSEQAAKLQELEAKHLQSKARMEAIKKSLR
jgi:hypothetical protein